MAQTLPTPRCWWGQECPGLQKTLLRLTSSHSEWEGKRRPCILSLGIPFGHAPDPSFPCPQEPQFRMLLTPFSIPGQDLEGWSEGGKERSPVAVSSPERSKGNMGCQRSPISFWIFPFLYSQSLWRQLEGSLP